MAVTEVVLMRNYLIGAIFALFALAATSQAPPKLQLSQLSEGSLSGSTYTNDALGLTYQFSSEWVATPAMKTPTAIDWRGPNQVANRCSKVLLWLAPISRAEGRFNSTAILLVIDPECLGASAFPRSLDQIKEINQAAEKIGKSFNYTAFMSPYGNVVHSSSTQGRVIIDATGGMIVNALTGRDGHLPKTKEPLEVHTSFSFTETNGLWVAWAYNADVPSTEVVKKFQVIFKNDTTKTPQ